MRDNNDMYFNINLIIGVLEHRMIHLTLFFHSTTWGFVLSLVYDYD